MSLVTVKGKFMGVALDKRSYQGVDKYQVLIDLYQKDSPLKDKSVQVRTDELTEQSNFSAIAEGTEITLECTVNAYQNNTTFRLVRIVPPSTKVS